MCFAHHRGSPRTPKVGKGFGLVAGDLMRKGEAYLCCSDLGCWESFAVVWPALLTTMTEFAEGVVVVVVIGGVLDVRSRCCGSTSSEE